MPPVGQEGDQFKAPTPRSLRPRRRDPLIDGGRTEGGGGERENAQKEGQQDDGKVKQVALSLCSDKRWTISLQLLLAVGGGGRGDQMEQQGRRCSHPEGDDLPVMSRDSELTGPE